MQLTHCTGSTQTRGRCREKKQPEDGTFGFLKVLSNYALFPDLFPLAYLSIPSHYLVHLGSRDCRSLFHYPYLPPLAPWPLLCTVCI